MGQIRSKKRDPYVQILKAMLKTRGNKVSSTCTVFILCSLHLSLVS
jgi:hypothetical protein